MLPCLPRWGAIPYRVLSATGSGRRSQRSPRLSRFKGTGSGEGCPRPCPAQRRAIRLDAEVRQDGGGEALELGELVVAHEADAEVRDAGLGVAAQGGDDRV